MFFVTESVLFVVSLLHFCPMVLLLASFVHVLVAFIMMRWFKAYAYISFEGMKAYFSSVTLKSFHSEHGS